MKKAVFTLLILTTTITASFSQKFLGLNIDGGKNKFVKNLKSEGFKVQDDFDSAVGLLRKADDKDVYIIVQYTPISKTVWRVQASLQERTTWSILETEYLEYLNILKSNFGQPEFDATLFLDPYTKGDGNEMAAIELEKCEYTALWLSRPVGVMITISQSKRVIISYENTKNRELAEEEKKELNKQMF
jgi:hypothetical protein